MEQNAMQEDREYWVSAVKADASVSVLLLAAAALLMLLVESGSSHPLYVIVGLSPAILAGWPLGSLEGKRILAELAKSRVARRTWRDPHPAVAFVETFGFLLAVALSLTDARDTAPSAIYFVAAFRGVILGTRGWQLHLVELQTGSEVQVAWGDGLPWAGLPWTQRLYRAVHPDELRT